jgi:alpha-beta hydrolase superfamily lysophospholipase
VTASGSTGRAAPFFFDSDGTSLFAAYHAPSGIARESAVVLCPPWGPDYVRTHRGLRQLAIRLAERGFPALRFDLSGCGDSAGESSECDVDRWRHDLDTAIGVVRSRSGAERICLVGFRTGAALAAEVASRRDDVSALVLWEPAVDGQQFVESLLARHRARLRAFPVLASADELSEPQAAGAPLGERLKAQLASIDLLALPSLPTKHVLIVEAHEEPANSELRKRLEAGGATVELVISSAPAAAGDFLYRIVVPHATIETILAWAVRELA